MASALHNAVASQSPEPVTPRTPTPDADEIDAIEDAQQAVEDSAAIMDKSSTGEAAAPEVEPPGRVMVARSLIASQNLAIEAISNAYAELDSGASQEDIPRGKPCRETPSDLARLIAGDVLEDSVGEIEAAGNVVEGTLRNTPSNLGRSLVQGAIHEAVDEVASADYQLRQTPSNVGQLLATHVYSGAVGELEQMMEAKLVFTFHDRIRGARELNALNGVSDEIPVESVLDDSSTETLNSELMGLVRDKSEDFHGIDSAVCRQTWSEISREGGHSLRDETDVTKETQDAVSPRQTPSIVAKTLAQSAVARAQDEIGESMKIYNARKTSRSFEGRRIVKRKPRETRSDIARFLAKEAIADAAMDLEFDGHTIDAVGRKTPSNLARDLVDETIDSAANDLKSDPVMHVIYRKTPSNLARALAEDAVTVVTLTDDLQGGLAKDAVQELNTQDTEYTLPSSIGKLPSEMSRGIADDVLDDATSDLCKERKQVDGTLRTTESNISRDLVKQAIKDADQELRMQSPTYSLSGRNTASNFARAVVSDVMDDAIGELQQEGNTVDGTARLTPSNLAREIVSGTITDAQGELEEATGDRTQVVRGKTPSNIARDITSDAISDGVAEIEKEGKSVDGVLRKTPSNAGRILVKDVIGEALGDLELDIDASFSVPTRADRPLPPESSSSRYVSSDLSANGSHQSIHDTDAVGDNEDWYSIPNALVDDLEFNEDDLRELWGDSSAMLASVMDVFSHTASNASAFNDVSNDTADDDDDEDDDEEQLIGILENPLIAETSQSDTALAMLKSDRSLTETVHITDKDKIIADGVVKISSDEGPSSTGSVTEAVLSMDKLTKKSSGQLVRGSSDSSTGEEIECSSTDESNQGPHFFKLIPFYNNKSIDVGDDLIKTNLSVISIKPDVKMALAGAHTPQSRNSFRNIFRPDMTHCEGSAKCLKETLVTKFSQQASSFSGGQDKVLDECCKLLDEVQPDITAHHSDEELVTVGEVEGVCMWPKRRTYQKHFVNEIVQEKSEENEIGDGTSIPGNEDQEPEWQTEASEGESAAKHEDNDKTVSQDKTANEDHGTNKQSIDVPTEKIPSKIVDVSSKPNDGIQPATAQKQPQPIIADGTGGVPETVDIQPNVVEASESNASKNDPNLVTNQELKQDQNSHAAVIEKLPSSHGSSSSLKSANRKKTSESGILEKVSRENGATKRDQSATKIKSKESVTRQRSDESTIRKTSVKSAPRKQSMQSTSENASTKSVTRKKSIASANEKASSESVVRKKSDASVGEKASSESVTRKKSGISYIYVQPADPRLSRSSCTVLVAGKKISQSSEMSSSSSHHRRRLKTPEGSRHRVQTPSVVLHEVKATTKPRNKSAGETEGERDAHHLPVISKTESEDNAALREHMTSQTAMRKLSHQAVPTSSHRILEMSCKLSHSAGELEGRGSNQCQGKNSDLSAEIDEVGMHKDKLTSYKSFDKGRDSCNVHVF